MARIFISYRRQDSPSMTGRIYDKLEAVFGSDRVFRDLDDIAAGQDRGPGEQHQRKPRGEVSGWGSFYKEVH